MKGYIYVLVEGGFAFLTPSDLGPFMRRRYGAFPDLLAYAKAMRVKLRNPGDYAILTWPPGADLLFVAHDRVELTESQLSFLGVEDGKGYSPP